MQAQGRQFQFALERSLVERLDIDQLVPELVRRSVDLAASQGIEHEGIVSIRAVSYTDQYGALVHGRSLEK